MFKFRAGQVITSLTLFSIYLIPLVGLIDFFMSIGILPGMTDRSRSLHPFPEIVIIREIVVMLLLLLLIRKVYNTGKMQRPLFYSVFLLAPLLLYSTSFPAFLSGIRQILYFVYVPVGFFIYRYAVRANINIDLKICRSLKVVLVLECIFALIQTQFMPTTEGLSHFGPRVYGSFNNPNTLGAFGATALLLLILLSKRRSLHWIYYICAILTVMASGTRGGTILLVCILMVALLKRIRPGLQRGLIAVIALGILLLTIISANVIANKPGNVKNIWEGARVENIEQYIATVDSTNLLTGFGWGVMTSWYQALGGDSNIIHGIGLDSFYAAILAQIGLIGLIMFMIYLFWLFFHAGKQGILLFLVFSLIGLQINVLEYYPMNLLLFLTLGIFIGKRRLELKQSTGYFPHRITVSPKCQCKSSLNYI